METLQCDVRVVRTPYEANGIQLYRMEGDSDDCSRPHQQRMSGQLSSSPVGSRGVRELLAHRPSGTSLGGVNEVAAEAAASRASARRESLRILTRHQKGQVLVWDCDTHELVGSCRHGEFTSVMQCILTPERMYVRVECAAGKDALEEDHAVHVWDPRTLERLHVLRGGHTGRVTTIAVNKERTEVVVSAGLDRQILVWDLAVSATRPHLTLIAGVLGYATHLTIKADFLVATGANAAVGVWDLSGGRLIATSPDDSSGSTTALRVVSGNARSNGRQATSKGTTRLVVFTGTSDGYLREWRVPMSSPSTSLSTTSTDVGVVEMAWQRKYHRNSVSSIIIDDDVIASASEYDGACLYHCTSGIVRVLTRNMEGGCRAIVMDAANKRVLVGGDNGTLSAWNYAEFAAGSSRDVMLLWSCSPHVSAITGIYLEVGAGNVWERILTCAADGVINVFDSSATSTGSLTLLRANGTCRAVEGVRNINDTEVIVAYPVDNGQGVATFRCHAAATAAQAGMRPLVAETAGAASAVTCLRWHSGSKQLLVGRSDGIVTAYGSDEEAKNWKSKRTWSFALRSVCYLSEPCGAFVCVLLGSTSLSSAQQRSALVLINAEDHTSVGPVLPVTDLSLTHVHLLKHVPRIGAASTRLLVFGENLEGTVRAFPTRLRGDRTYEMCEGTVVVVASPSTPIRPDTGTVAAVLTPVDPVTGTFTLCAPRGTVIRRVRCSMEGEVVQELPSTEVGEANATLCLLQQAGLELAVVRPGSSKVHIFDALGAPVCRVSYQGFVSALPRVAGARRKRVTTYAPQAGTAEAPIALRSAPCCAITSSAGRRYFALGYEDGLVQVVDTNYRYVFARLWVAKITSPVSQLWLVGDVVFAQSRRADVVSVHELRRRALMDSEGAQ